MEERVIAAQTSVWFGEHMKQRSDYGFGNAVLNLMFHPRNPFGLKQRRKCKAGFLFAIAWIGTATLLLEFFNGALRRW